MTEEISGVPPQMEDDNIDEMPVKAENLGGGWWKITTEAGEEKVHGEAAAKARVAELSGGASGGDQATEGVHPPKQYEAKLSSKQKKAAGMPKMTRIILEENDDIPPTGLFLSHNGRGYMIATGLEVDVPDFLLEILNNARMMVPLVEPSTKRVVGWRERPRYPYRRI